MRSLFSHYLFGPILLSALAASCPLPPNLPIPSPSPAPSASPTSQPSPSPTISPTPCPTPVPSPSASPTPNPTPSPSPSPSASPSTPPGLCPIGCESPQWLGVSLRSVTSANPQGGKYLGKKYNVDATPHTFNTTCQDRPGQATEWSKVCQAEFWPHGPDFYMSLPGHFEDARCDAFSGNQAGDWWCHHKPEGVNGPSGGGAQVGPTTFWAVPPGAAPTEPLPCPAGRSCRLTVEVN